MKERKENKRGHGKEKGRQGRLIMERRAEEQSDKKHEAKG